MSKKIVAMLMAVAMAFSLLPVTVFATGGTQEGNSQTPVTVKKSENNLTMTKTVKPVPNQDGTYTVRLESYATGSVTTTQAPVPMDFVLVLDVSGSMDEEIASYTYQATDKTSWSVSDVYNAYYQKDILGIPHRTDVIYYAKIDDEYYTVSYQSKWNWGQGYREYWLEANNQVLGEKVTGSTWEKVVYDKALYTRETDPNKTTTKLEAMKNAVDNFITTVATQKNGETPVAHRISIVKFAGNSKDEVGNHKYNNNKYNYTQKVTELTDVTTNGSVDSLKTAVNALTAGGATRADLGMEKADGVLNGRQDKNRPSVVIMFTDGEPTTSDKFEWKVAGAAVDTAKTLKAGETKVYTIGMFNGANPSDTEGDFNKYMNGVSSKYPNAFGTKDSWEWYTDIDLGDPAEGNYYFKADNAGDLDQVFQTISHSTTTTSHLNASAVVVDNVPSNFALNKGSVQVYTADCTGKTGEELNWGTPTPATPAQGISSTSTKNDDGSQTISATGFNFSENWCGVDGDKYRGQKLIIEFTIQRTNYGGTQPTNAGAYIKAGKVENEEPIIKLDDPEVPVKIELNKTLGVNDEKPYDGEGFAILTKIAAQANTLVDGINNAYVKMELTVKVGDTTYIYKIPAKAKTGSWYRGDSEDPMTNAESVTTLKDVRRESNEIKPYTYNFNLKLSDETEGGAKEASYGPYSASFTINPARVTVKANDKNIQAGDPKPQYDATVSGTIGEDPVDYTISCAYDPATSTEGTIPIVPTGAPTQGNYNVSYENGILTVTTAPVTTGTLKVTKKVEGLALNELPKGFKIKVTNAGTTKAELSPTDQNVQKDETNGTLTWTIPGLPADEYTVSETGEKLENYTCEATYHAGTASDATVTVNNANTAQNQPATDAAQASQKVTVEKGKTSTMTVTNTYTKNATVNLSQLIQKQLTLKDGSTLPDNTTFSVTVTPKTVNGQPATSTQPISGTVSDLGTGIKNEETGETTYTASFAFTDGLNLSAGTYTYTVQENATSPISGVEYDPTTYLLKIEAKMDGTYSASYTVAPTGDATEATPEEKATPLTIKNTYQTPDLTVTKQPYKVNGIEFKPGETVARVGEQIIWKVNVTNTKTTQAFTQLKDTLGDVKVYKDAALSQEVTLTDGTWTATVSASANDPVTYYVTYTVKPEDILKGKIVNTIVKDGDNNNPINSAPVSTWDSKQLKSAISLDSNWTTTVKLTLPTVKQPDQTIAISKGSKVEDTIGNKFTLIPDSFKLTVGGTELKSIKDGEKYYFGDEMVSTAAYRFKVTVTKTKSETKFNWDINEAITKDTVELSYQLQLTKPETAAGTYGVEDLKGSGQIEQGKTPIYTNEKAALYIKENNQEKEIAVFPKPSVSYTVKGSSGSHSGGSRPSLNTKDHYGYIIGYPVDYYTGQPTTDQTKKPVRPEGKITRAEVATIYFRMLTDESRTKFWSQSNSYSDVKAGDWFNNAVSTLSNAGIIAGYEDGSFRPNGYITRAEFATIAARFFDVTYNGKDLFPDISGHWAKDYINQAANKGFVNGYEDGTFKPDRNITRAEAVTLVNRTLDRHPDKNHFTKDMLVWPDNMDQTKWYYADMQEATNSHTYQMKENSDKTKYENWTKTLPIRNWEALEKAWSNANSSQGNGNVV